MTNSSEDKQEICPVDAGHTPRERRRIARQMKTKEKRPDWEDLSEKEKAMIEKYGWPENQR